MLLPDVNNVLQSARTALGGDNDLWISGPMGSGRSMVFRGLIEEHPGLVPVDLVGLDESDAVAGAIVQAVAGISDEGARRELLEAGDEVSATAEAVGEELARRGCSLLIRVPESWRLVTHAHQEVERSRYVRGAELLRAWSRAPVQVLWVADEPLDPALLGLEVAERVALPGHRVLPSVSDHAEWGSYSTHVGRLIERLPSGSTLSPLVIRLAVGALAAGAGQASVADAAGQETGSAMVRLATLLLEAVADQPALKDAVARLTQIRRPMGADELAAVTRFPADHLTLLTHCLAYGNENLRVSPVLRSRLLKECEDGPWSAAQTEDLEDVNLSASEVYRQADGVDSPVLLSGAGHALAWLEKVHHLGKGGEAAAEGWSAQALPHREFYWDRGRHLSIQRREYAKAADVYRTCVNRFPNDDYGWHYLGYNLAVAEQSPDEAEAAFRRAVEISSTNPWWNARLVSFLIKTARFDRARREWREALRRVDPDGAQTSRDAWLVRNFHRIVADEWFKAGSREDARQVLDSVPPEHRREGTIVRLLNRLSDRELRKRFDSYLQRSSLDDGHRAVVTGVWEQLDTALAPAPLPAAGPADEDAFQLAWSSESRYVELDIHADGTIEWFVQEDETGTYDGGEATEVPEQVVEALREWGQ